MPYLELIGEKELPMNLFEIVDIEDRFPIERINQLSNAKPERSNLVRSTSKT